MSGPVRRAPRRRMIRCTSGNLRFTGAGERRKSCGACANRATSGHRRGGRLKIHDAHNTLATCGKDNSMMRIRIGPLLATDLATRGDNRGVCAKTRPLLATDGALPHHSIVLVIGEQSGLQPASRLVRRPLMAATPYQHGIRRIQNPATSGHRPTRAIRTWEAPSIRSVAYSPEVVAYGHAGHTPSAL